MNYKAVAFQINKKTSIFENKFVIFNEISSMLHVSSCSKVSSPAMMLLVSNFERRGTTG